MAHHNLKAEPDSYRLLSQKVSSVQIRKNDRAFKVGDTVSFYEWDEKQKFYTGHLINPVPVIVVLEKHDGLLPGWCLLVVDLPGSYISDFNVGMCGKTELPS